MKRLISRSHGKSEFRVNKNNSGTSLCWTFSVFVKTFSVNGDWKMLGFTQKGSVNVSSISSVSFGWARSARNGYDRFMNINVTTDQSIAKEQTRLFWVLWCKIQDYFSNPLRKLYCLPYNVLDNKTLRQQHMFSLFQITIHSRKQLPPIHSQTFLHFNQAWLSPHPI